jgi:hypothetical protein
MADLVGQHAAQDSRSIGQAPLREFGGPVQVDGGDRVEARREPRVAQTMRTAAQLIRHAGVNDPQMQVEGSDRRFASGIPGRIS